LTEVLTGRAIAQEGRIMLEQPGNASVEVVLRDFDGSRTIYVTRLPLRNIIHTAETEDLGTVVGKNYVKTSEKDDHGRIVYAEQR
jgi:hypothetical protein